MSSDIKVCEGESKKPVFGILCLVISVIVCALATFAYIPFVVPAILFLEIGFIGFALACILSVSLALLFCVIGILQERHRKLAVISLCICIFFATVILPFRYISFSPPGTVPRFLRSYKFGRSCDCGFWLDYPKGKPVDIQSQNTHVFIRFGTVLYEGDSNSFGSQEVIDFAESHGWKYHCYVSLKASDFTDYKDGKLEDSFPLFEVFHYLTAYNGSPLNFEEDCRVLVFDGGSGIGIASFVLVSDDGNRMMIRYNNPVLPDGPSELWLTPGFDELCVRPASTGHSIQLQ